MNRQENLVNRIAERVWEHMPHEVEELGQDFRHNISSLIRESLGKMDLVTREEFEVQSKVLSRTRQRLEELERQLEELEQK